MKSVRSIEGPFGQIRLLVICRSWCVVLWLYLSLCDRSSVSDYFPNFILMLDFIALWRRTYCFLSLFVKIKSLFCFWNCRKFRLRCKHFNARLSLALSEIVRGIMRFSESLGFTESVQSLGTRVIEDAAVDFNSRVVKCS